MKKKLNNDMNQFETLNSLNGHLKELFLSEGWKILVKEIDKVISKVKEMYWIPCSDQSLKFNASNLITERLVALYLIKSLPKMKIDEFSQIIASNTESGKDLQQRLKEYDKKFFNDLGKIIKQP